MGWKHRVSVAKSEKPKIVCLCGSTRFEKQIQYAAQQFTFRGYIVVMPHVLSTTSLPNGVSEIYKTRLDQLHKRKIDLADEVFIVNEGGYIGPSTQSEIDYASGLGKKVSYLHSPVLTMPLSTLRTIQMLVEARSTIEDLLLLPKGASAYNDDTGRGAMKTVRGIEELVADLQKEST